MDIKSMKEMFSNSERLIFLVILSLLAVWHVVTLSISPLPWFDEAVFFNISLNLLTTGNLDFTIAPPDLPLAPKRYTYGPMYFLVSVGVMKTLGVGIWQFRLLGLISSFLIVILSAKMVKSKVISILTVCMLFDPLLISSGHGGRMDTLALLFFLTSLFVYTQSSRRYHHILISAVFFSMALLTTPRIAVLGIPYLILSVIDIWQNGIKGFVRSTIFGSTVVLIYYLWILLSFGSISNLLDFYSALSLKFESVGFYFPLYHIPLAIAFIGVFFLKVCFDPRSLINSLNIYAISSIFLFYLVVKDTGAYSILILPSYYMFIFQNVYDFKTKVPHLTKMFQVLFVLNAGLWVVKSFVLYQGYAARNPDAINEFVKDLIPPGSKVVGDEMFVYSVELNDSDFQFIHLYLSDVEREEYQREVLDYDYLIWSKRLQESNPSLLKLYATKSKLKPIGHYLSNETDYSIIPIDKLPIITAYDCTIYKRLEE